MGRTPAPYINRRLHSVGAARSFKRFPADYLWVENDPNKFFGAAMSTVPPDKDHFLTSMSHVPPEQWQDVLNYVHSLPTPKEEKSSPIPKTAAEMAKSEIIGIWADRTDIQDGPTFARQLRSAAEKQGFSDAS